MTRISGSTFFYTRLIPLLWYGFISFGLYQAICTGDRSQSPVGFVIVLSVVIAVATYLFKKSYWSLMDEVVDSGNALIFRRGRLQQTVALADVININSINRPAPERATVIARTGGELGKELTFALPFRLSLFGTHPAIRDLIERVDQARRNA